MPIATEKLSDPTVRAAVAAINAGDRQAFLDLLTEDATMSDDGSDRDPRTWAEAEIFASRGRMDVRKEYEDGRALVADFRNDTWGEMRTRWRFDIVGGRISRFETGQA